MSHDHATWRLHLSVHVGVAYYLDVDIGPVYNFSLHVGVAYYLDVDIGPVYNFSVHVGVAYYLDVDIVLGLCTTFLFMSRHVQHLLAQVFPLSF